jgi:hypothetical protein
MGGNAEEGGVGYRVVQRALIFNSSAQLSAPVFCSVVLYDVKWCGV